MSGEKQILLWRLSALVLVLGIPRSDPVEEDDGAWGRE